MAVTSIPAPTGGWNARDALDAVPPTDAIELINLIPRAGSVEGRGGNVLMQAVVAAQPLDTLVNFTSAGANKLIGGINGVLYDLTTITGKTSLASGFTSSQWQTAMFANRLVLVNGSDAEQLYDGTSVTPAVVTRTVQNLVLSQASGSLANGTYNYGVTAVINGQETLIGPVVSITITALITPVIASVTTLGTGGTLTAATYGYRVAARNAAGTTLASTEVTVVVAGGTTNSNTVTVTAVAGATSYDFYGRTSGGELLMTNQTGLVFIDTGSITPSGALPGSNTTSGGVTLTWDQTYEAGSYKPYGRTTRLGMGSVTTTTFTDNGSVSPSGSPPATDSVSKNFIGVVNFKGRAIYWSTSFCGFWYAAPGAFQGQLNFFPLDLVFKNGGNVVNVITWSRDNGDGVDDIFAAISSTGEVLTYQGTDPGTALNWSMMGRFQIGRPLGVRGHGRLASTEIILTTDGFMSMDEAIVNQRTAEGNTFAGKIIRAAQNSALQYQANFGWECFYYPRQGLFIVNVPVVSGGQTEQYIVNVNTGAWCRFTGWNFRTFCVFNDRLYGGSANGNLYLCDTGIGDATVAYPYADNGTSVLRTCTTAYLPLNPGGRFQLTAIDFMSSINYPSYASWQISSDYRALVLPGITSAPISQQAQWDISSWDTDFWADASTPAAIVSRPIRVSVAGFGYSASLNFRYQYSLEDFQWYSTSFIFKPTGI